MTFTERDMMRFADWLLGHRSRGNDIWSPVTKRELNLWIKFKESKLTGEK